MDTDAPSSSARNPCLAELPLLYTVTPSGEPALGPNPSSPLSLIKSPSTCCLFRSHLCTCISFFLSFMHFCLPNSPISPPFVTLLPFLTLQCSPVALPVSQLLTSVLLCSHHHSPQPFPSPPQFPSPHHVGSEQNLHPRLSEPSLPPPDLKGGWRASAPNPTATDS